MENDDDVMIQGETEMEERHTREIRLNAADTESLLVWRWLKTARAMILLLEIESSRFFGGFGT